MKKSSLVAVFVALAVISAVGTAFSAANDRGFLVGLGVTSFTACLGAVAVIRCSTNHEPSLGGSSTQFGVEWRPRK